MSAAAVDHSDQYLYWDNVETARIDLREFWDQNDQAYEPRQYADVTIKRTSLDHDDPLLGGLPLRNDQSGFLIPAVLLFVNDEQGVPRDGDTITIGSDVWGIVGSAQEVRAGSRLSHFRVLGQKQRG